MTGLAGLFRDGEGDHALWHAAVLAFLIFASVMSVDVGLHCIFSSK